MTDSGGIRRRRFILAAGSMVWVAGCLTEDSRSATATVEEYWQALADDDLDAAKARVHDDVGEDPFATPHAGDGEVDVTVGETEEIPPEEGVKVGKPFFETTDELEEFKDESGVDDVAFVEITISIDAPDENRQFGGITTDGTSHDILYVVVRDEGNWFVAFSL